MSNNSCDDTMLNNNNPDISGSCNNVPVIPDPDENNKISIDEYFDKKFAMEDPKLLGYDSEKIKEEMRKIVDIYNKYKNAQISRELAHKRINQLNRGVFSLPIKRKDQSKTEDASNLNKNDENKLYSPLFVRRVLTNLKKTIGKAIDEYETGKFVALGLSGSGKTCLLTAMYSELASSDDGGFSLEADNINKLTLNEYHEKLCKKEEVPPPTNNFKTYSFRLYHCCEQIEKFQWIDFQGDQIKDYNADTKNTLSNALKDAKAIYIIIDGERFYKAGQEVEKNAKKDQKQKEEIIAEEIKKDYVHYISDFLIQNNNENKSNPPIIFIVTKFDVVRKNYSDQSYDIIHKTIIKAFPMFFKSDKDLQYTGKHTMVSIIPVSLGETFYENRVYRPVNVQIPLLIGMYFLLYANKSQMKDSTQVERKDNAMKTLKEFIEKSQEKCNEECKKECEECPGRKQICFYYDGEEKSFAEAKKTLVNESDEKDQSKKRNAKDQSRK